jgi:50S ribosomal subunit-associated GTPase HflX
MSITVNKAKDAVHDKIESQVKAAEAKLTALQARAESAKAGFEIKALEELLPKKHAIRQKLAELKESGAGHWEQTRKDLEERIADLEKSLKRVGARAKAS